MTHIFKEISFTSDMWEAIISGNKTQTRRPIKDVDPDYPTFISKYLIGDIIRGKESPGIILRITDVDVEQLRHITEDDAIKEGMSEYNGFDDVEVCRIANKHKLCIDDVRTMFVYVWESIYGKTKYRWENNPWVWVYEFERR